MGFKEKIKEQQERMKESRVFNKIIEERNLAARRRAYAQESLIQAKKQGQQLAIKRAAPKPSFGESLSNSFGNFGGNGPQPKTVRTKQIQEDNGFGWINGFGSQPKTTRVVKRRKSSARKVIYVKPRKRKAVRVVYVKQKNSKRRKQSVPQQKSWLGNIGLNDI